jgi:hypothetical protein
MAMSGAEGSVLQDLADALSDTGLWVFAAGAAVISAIVALALSPALRSWPTFAVASLSGAIPVLTLIGAVLMFRPVQGGLGSDLLFLVEPSVLFGLLIWFAAGCLSAFVVTARLRSRRERKRVQSEIGTFE